MLEQAVKSSSTLCLGEYTEPCDTIRQLRPLDPRTKGFGLTLFDGAQLLLEVDIERRSSHLLLDAQKQMGSAHAGAD